eukprot:2383936-Amphidinium_carterae.1
MRDFPAPPLESVLACERVLRSVGRECPTLHKPKQSLTAQRAEIIEKVQVGSIQAASECACVLRIAHGPGLLIVVVVV